MTNQEYESREITLAMQRAADVARAPLADRKHAAACFAEAMRERPQIVAERITWLIDGCYGYGAMILARRIVARKRMNRAAALIQMVAIYEWLCPEDMARKAWRGMLRDQQATLSRYVAGAIRAAEQGDDE